MTTVLTAILLGGVLSIAIGVVLAWMAAVFDEKQHPIVMPTAPVYWSFALWTIVLGAGLMLAPDWWYGPSWSYFPQLPHNGFGMGLCCSVLGALLAIALRLNGSARILSLLFFLVGFVYWTAGIILGAEGLFGHQGLMEMPFMLYTGAHAFAHSASLMAYHRRRR